MRPVLLMSTLKIQESAGKRGSNYDSLEDSHKSPLPLTDPHHMVIKQFLLLGLAAEYRSRPWM